MGVKKSRGNGRRAHKRNDSDCETLESRTYFAIVLGAASDFAGVTSPHGIVTADFNSDGSPDVAVAGIDPNTNLPTVAVYLDGATPPTYYDLPAGHLAFDLVAADFDGTNGTDIAVSDPVNGTVSVLLNNGDGTFGQAIITQYGTPQPASSSPVAYLATGDFNGDGKPDLAVTDPADHQIVILLGNGNGTFAIGTPVTLAEPSFDPVHVVAANFSMSGYTDIAFNDGANPDVYLALGTGTGTFSAPTPFAVDGAIQGIATGDLNGDGITDLAVSTTAGTTGSVDELLSTNGAFAAATSLATTFPDPGPIVIADVNGDGIPDIVTLSSTGSLDLFLGDGNGLLSAAAVSQVTSGTPQAITTADVNDDGKADLLFSEVNPADSGGGGFALVLGAGVSVFSASVSGTLPGSAVEGQNLKLTQTVDLMNISGALVTGSNNISLALSSNQDFTANAFVINSIAKTFNLKAGKSHAVKVTGNLPAAVTPGTYYLLAQVTDSNGGITNAVASQTIIVAAPVIEFSGSFKTSLATGRAGKALNESVTIDNNGNVSAIGKLPIIVDTSTSEQPDDIVGMPLSLTKAINIKAGKSITLKLTRLLAPATAGTYYLIVQLDPDNTLQEASTADNTFVSTAIVVS